MGEPNCPYCGAAFSHRPPRSETILWKCASWANRAKGHGDQSLFCRTQQLGQCIAGLVEAANNSLEYGHRVCCAYHVGSRQPCDCGYAVLQVAVKAGEEVR